MNMCKYPELSSSLVEWLDKFEKVKSRPLRVLHIGNIANNAYVNALIMRRNGIEADVLCIDYYHIMGCPEWEEVEVNAKDIDQNLPDWSKVDLGNYQRPAWFIQGPTVKCLEHIVAKHNEELKVLQRTLFNQCLNKITKIKNIFIRTFIKIKLYIKYECLHCKIDQGNEIPDKLKPMNLLDIVAYKQNIDLWTKVFQEYDIVQGYGTAGIYPLIADHKSYVAYEHGTIREIPFQDNQLGRTCFAVYKNAAKIFVTNLDCLPASKRFGLDQENITALPHAFDDTKVSKFLKTFKYDETVKDSYFMAPARHHWKHGDKSWLKGNDTVIKAVKILADKNIKFNVKFVDWGQEVEFSKELIKELQIEDYFTWLEPLPKKQLWSLYMNSLGVIDQFIIPAFGGVSFEALALGKRLITLLDEKLAHDFFGEIPPIYNCGSALEVANAMQKIITDVKDNLNMGIKAKEWFSKCHSSQLILNLQVKEYKDLLTRRKGR